MRQYSPDRQPPDDPQHESREHEQTACPPAGCEGRQAYLMRFPRLVLVVGSGNSDAEIRHAQLYQGSRSFGKAVCVLVRRGRPHRRRTEQAFLACYRYQGRTPSRSSPLQFIDPANGSESANMPIAKMSMRRLLRLLSVFGKERGTDEDPNAVEPPAPRRGVVESLDGPVVTGWAVADDRPGQAVGLEILISGTVVGETATSKTRPDLRASLGRTLAVGFKVALNALALPPELANGNAASLALEVRFRNTHEKLLSRVDAIPIETFRDWVLQRELAANRTPARRQAMVSALVSATPTPFDVDTVRLIAFYLPQFHPIPENDEWWGNGFTEWSNVTRAKPLFRGHDQPHFPADLGYYDLRVPEVRHRQIALAREHGLHGFCFYYYWFDGRRLLERPLDDYVGDPDADFPFCVCWANENWSRRWDGSESEVLIGQRHDIGSDQRLIRDLMPLLTDPRYIRVDGAPLVLVYRPGLLVDPRNTLDQWRQICREEGVGEIHLAMVESFGDEDPTHYGFDSSVQFPPHGVDTPPVEVKGLPSAFSGHIADYRDVVAKELDEPPRPYPRFRGVMTGWDNTARRGDRATIFINSSPGLYETWLRSVIAATQRDNPPGRRYVFINAWNEWAEGAHLEPDTRHGRGYLQATRRAIARQSDWPSLIEEARLLARHEAALEPVLSQLEETLRGHEQSLDLLRSGRVRLVGSKAAVNRFRLEPPEANETTVHLRKGIGFVETVGDLRHLDGLALTACEPLELRGWWFVPGQTYAVMTPRFLALNPSDGGAPYYVPVPDLPKNALRVDVVEAYPQEPRAITENSGFAGSFSLEGVRPGLYQLFGVVSSQADVVTYWTPFKGTLEVLAP